MKRGPQQLPILCASMLVGGGIAVLPLVELNVTLASVDELASQSCHSSYECAADEACHRGECVTPCSYDAQCGNVGFCEHGACNIRGIHERAPYFVAATHTLRKFVSSAASCTDFFMVTSPSSEFEDEDGESFLVWGG